MQLLPIRYRLKIVALMSLEPGRKLAHYEVLELIGRGGMGEVYRAHDAKLKRDVALKVLPEAFANDAQRMARFEREAQLLASLNHPNIAADLRAGAVGQPAVSRPGARAGGDPGRAIAERPSSRLGSYSSWQDR